MSLLNYRSLVLLVVFGLCGTVAAQQTDTPAGPQPSQNTKERSEQEKAIEKKEQSQRMLGVLPNFGVTSRQNARPLTPAEKFHLFRKSAFDPVEFAVVGLQAGIEQAEDQFPDYRQGVAGYGKRYG